MSASANRIALIALFPLRFYVYLTEEPARDSRAARLVLHDSVRRV